MKTNLLRLGGVGRRQTKVSAWLSLDCSLLASSEAGIRGHTDQPPARVLLQGPGAAGRQILAAKLAVRLSSRGVREPSRGHREEEVV